MDWQDELLDYAILKDMDMQRAEIRVAVSQPRDVVSSREIIQMRLQY